MRRPIFSIFVLAMFASAQPTVAPTPLATGKPRGDEAGGYNITQSWETGYRFADITGNRGKYRSDVNFGNGVRLLGSNLTINSREGHGGFFDELILTTQGLGNDPYESSSLRIQKNKLYRYDLLWRLNDYFNPALAISEGRHFLNTQRRWQDHDLVLLPQSRFQLRFGYTRNSQDGPALSTVQLFEARGDEFTPFWNVRRQRNEFRLGGDFELFGARLSILRIWDNFKEDARYALGASPGANPGDQTTLTSLGRYEPYHGNTPVWRGNLRKDTRTWAINGRLTYAGGQRRFTLDEAATGIDRFGAAANRQILVTGDARRPVTAGDFSLSFFPTANLSITNSSSVHSTRIDGNSAYLEVNNSLANDQLLYFRYLGVRAIANSTDLIYRWRKWLSVTTGYQYSTRRIRSVENLDLPALPGDPLRAEQENALHAGRVGVRIKPVKPLTIALDGEIARADRPFSPLSEKNFHNLGGRIQYKVKTLQFGGQYRENYNTNSVSLATFSARGRNSMVDVSWAPRTWFAVDASYAKLHLDTVSGIAFFSPRLIEAQSIYVSNIHSANLAARVSAGKRLDLFVGYSINRDVGDGRAVNQRTPLIPADAFLYPVQTFPLRFDSPQARISLRLHQKLRWNAGWQFYHYGEDFALTAIPQNYHAHTGFTSLLWSF